VKIVIFCHSLVSDWSHENAPFLRGVVSELLARGVDVHVYEPKDGWSLTNLQQEYGQEAIEGFNRVYPDLKSRPYDPKSIDLNKALSAADAVIVHEWTDRDVVRRIGEHHRTKGHYLLLFHDTDDRSITDADSMERYDLHDYDGVLAIGNVVRDAYLKAGWAQAAWTWHEAADTRLFHNIPSPKLGDLVWVGDGVAGERLNELNEFLVKPVKSMGIRAKVYGARYSEEALRVLALAGIEYGGWIPNYEIPKVYAKYRLTMHIPNRSYARAVPGVPTARLLEGLACGIPLISAPWIDSEKLFTRGDFLRARNGEEVEAQISWILHNEAAAHEISSHGRRTVLEAHTCSHRADELLQIIDTAQRDVARKESA
jgi:spore maturation protein CgeB